MPEQQESTGKRWTDRLGRTIAPPVEEREWREVSWEVSERGVLAITMRRPARLNAITFTMLREIEELVRDAACKPAIRVITIRGEGTRAFSSGDDLTDMEPAVRFDSPHSTHHKLIPALRAAPQPVVALLSGYALGAGFELALACDFRLAADNLKIGDYRARRALGSIAGASWFLSRIVGQGRALDLLLTGRHLSAQEALEWGLVTRTWPLATFAREAASFVETLAQLPTGALGAHKQALEYSMVHGLRDSLSNEFETFAQYYNEAEDVLEGRASFHERRDPVYRGR